MDYNHKSWVQLTHPLRDVIDICLNHFKMALWATDVKAKIGWNRSN